MHSTGGQYKSDNFSQELPRLEYLSLQPNNENLFISSSSLKVINMSDGSLQQALFDVPNLVLFDYFVKCRNLDGTDGEILPKLSFKRSSGGWRSRIRLVEDRNNISANQSWFLNLHKFLSAFEKSEISVRAIFGIDVKFIDADEMLARSSFFPGPVSGVREFSVWTGWRVFDMSSAHSILVGVLKICRPEKIIFRHWYNRDFRSLPRREFKYIWDASDDDAANCNKFVGVLEAHQKERLFTVIFNMEYL